MDNKLPPSENWQYSRDHWYWYFVGMAPCENLNQSCPTCRRHGRTQCNTTKWRTEPEPDGNGILTKKVTLIEEVIDCTYKKNGCPLMLMLDNRKLLSLRQRENYIYSYRVGQLNFHPSPLKFAPP